MKADNLISPKATARFVVTLPPGQSRGADALAATAGAAITTLTDTQDAFLHLARRARERRAAAGQPKRYFRGRL